MYHTKPKEDAYERFKRDTIASYEGYIRETQDFDRQLRARRYFDPVTWEIHKQQERYIARLKSLVRDLRNRTEGYREQENRTGIQDWFTRA